MEENERVTVAQNMTQVSEIDTQKNILSPEDMSKPDPMREQFPFFGLGTFLYACLYAFCMYRNNSGITFPFFIAGSLLFICFTLNRLSITLRKGSAFYMVSMMALAVSVFCTDDLRIINLNKIAVFLLTMSLLLNQFYDTKAWNLGKYLGAILETVFLCLGEIGKPFRDGVHYFKTRGKQNKVLWSGVLGALISVPMLLLMAGLLSGADAVFRKMTIDFFELVKPGNLFRVVLRVIFLYFASYALTAFLCRRSIKEEIRDRRTGEPVLAIVVTSLLSLMYILFSGIQIFGLFLGKMELPEGYTYAMYAREGFFQLLAVSVLNLIIVLFAMNRFRESRVLKIILTIMSLCTFVMIFSSAMRMIIYIRYYYLTFLRIFVLWALLVLSLLFVGVILGIFRVRFPLFRYSAAVVTVLYLVLAFSHPDYLIAKVNVSNIDRVSIEMTKEKDAYGEDFFAGPFFRGRGYNDYAYLSDLSADAAPVLLPYLEEQGDHSDGWQPGGFGKRYLDSLTEKLENHSFRTFNISRYMAMKQLGK